MSSARKLRSLVLVGATALIGVYALLKLKYRQRSSAQRAYHATFSPPWIVSRANKLTRQHLLEELRGELRRIERALTHIKADLLGTHHREKLEELSTGVVNVSSRAASLLQQKQVDDDSLSLCRDETQVILAQCREVKAQVNLLLVMRKKATIP